MEYKRKTERYIDEQGKNCVRKLAWDGEILHTLAELEDKIENGTLIELPCKVGEAFYYLDANQHDGWFIDIRRFDYVYLKIMGKYGFTTKAEAEKKLQELKSGAKIQN